MENKQLKRDISFDYIRIILTLMIVTFHFCEANGFYSSKLFTMANGTWGWVATTAFILLSGYLLRMRHGNKVELLTFYKKRFLTLFPSFYIAFLISFIIHAICLRSPFFGGHPVKIIFSILAIDSYVGLYGISTYSVVGEWFTGLIIMLYLLYPLLDFLMEKARWIITVFLFALYIINAIYKIDPTTVDASIITGLFIFWCGMLISEYSDIIRAKRFVSFILLLPFLILIFYKINLPVLFTTNIMGLLLFLTLIILLKGISIAGKMAGFLSSISYEVYLIHHFIMYKLATIISIKDYSLIYILLFYILTLIIITGFAYFVHVLSVRAIEIINKCFLGGKHE